MKSISEIAETFHLKRQGREYRGACPICQARKAELAVWDDAGKLRCYCFYGACQPSDLFLTLVGKDVLYTSPAIPKEVPSSADRTEWARRIWHETTQAKNTLAACYLASRGITLEIPSDIRFHPGLMHKPTNQTLPAMASAIRNVKGEIQAIHRTYLDLDGQKAKVITPKMSLGPLQGCAIQLAEPGEILGLAEGIETALSAMQMSELPSECRKSARSAVA